jgi:hypothetical protein
MPQAFSQNDHPLGQCERFSQVGPFEKSCFLVVYQVEESWINRRLLRQTFKVVCHNGTMTKWCILMKTSKERLHLKLKMAILSMWRTTIVEMANSAKMVEQKLPLAIKYLVKNWDETNNEESIDESNDDDYKWSKKKKDKTPTYTYRWGIYYRNCYYKGHYIKEWKLL